MMGTLFWVMTGIVILGIVVGVQVTAVASQRTATAKWLGVTPLMGLTLVALVVLIGGACGLLWFGAGWHMGC
ncbi:hypothetical protein [Levilactobacillus zymae]|uniref:hypothetical protein n=1 Tax=Levilactobacillus zymae TaxID=267363 RepID=UPI0028B5403A|nr:hypothetical protein [Levilactobacillus zymae]MDT6981503.1 hypothetical protein [Levilactobacillus zymae]